MSAEGSRHTSTYRYHHIHPERNGSLRRAQRNVSENFREQLFQLIQNSKFMYPSREGRAILAASKISSHKKKQLDEKLRILRDVPKLATIKFNNREMQVWAPLLLTISERYERSLIWTVQMDITDSVFEKVQLLFDGNVIHTVDVTEGDIIIDICHWLSITCNNLNKEEFCINGSFLNFNSHVYIKGKTNHMAAARMRAFTSRVICEKSRGNEFTYDGPNETGLEVLVDFFNEKLVDLRNPLLKNLAIELDIPPLIKMISNYDKVFAETRNILTKYMHATRDLCRLQDALLVICEESYTETVKLCSEMSQLDVIHAIWRAHLIAPQYGHAILAKFTKEVVTGECLSILKGWLLHKHCSYRMVYELFKLGVFTIEEIVSGICQDYNRSELHLRVPNTGLSGDSTSAEVNEKREMALHDQIKLWLHGHRIMEDYSHVKEQLWVCFAPEISKHVGSYTAANAIKAASYNQRKRKGVQRNHMEMISPYDLIRRIREYENAQEVESILRNDDVNGLDQMHKTGISWDGEIADLAIVADDKVLTLLRYAIKLRAKKCALYLAVNATSNEAEDAAGCGDLEIVKSVFEHIRNDDSGLRQVGMMVGLSRSADVFDWMLNNGFGISKDFRTGVLRSGYFEGLLKLAERNPYIFEESGILQAVFNPAVIRAVSEIRESCYELRKELPKGTIYSGDLSLVKEKYNSESSKDMVVSALETFIVLGYADICRYLISLLGDEMNTVASNVLCVGTFGHSKPIKEMLLPYIKKDTPIIDALEWAVYIGELDFISSVVPHVGLSSQSINHLYIRAITSESTEIIKWMATHCDVQSVCNPEWYSFRHLETPVFLLSLLKPEDRVRMSELIVREYFIRYQLESGIKWTLSSCLADLAQNIEDPKLLCKIMELYDISDYIVQKVSITETFMRMPHTLLVRRFMRLGYRDAVRKMLCMPSIRAEIESSKSSDDIRFAAMSGDLSIFESLVELKGGVKKIRHVEFELALESLARFELDEETGELIPCHDKTGGDYVGIFKYIMNILQSSRRLGTSLIVAAKSKNLELMKEILKYDNVNVNSCNEQYGGTPLMICVANKMTSGVELLIKYGADVNLTNTDTSPLVQASLSGAGDIVGLIIRAPSFDMKSRMKCISWDTFRMLCACDYNIMDMLYSVGRIDNVIEHPHTRIGSYNMRARRYGHREAINALLAHPKLPNVIPCGMKFVLSVLSTGDLDTISKLVPILENGVNYEIFPNISLFSATCVMGKHLHDYSKKADRILRWISEQPSLKLDQNDVLLAVGDRHPLRDVYHLYERGMINLEEIFSKEAIDRRTLTCDTVVKQELGWDTVPRNRLRSINHNLAGRTVFDCLVSYVGVHGFIMPIIEKANVDWTKQNPCGRSYLETAAIYSARCLSHIMHIAGIDKQELRKADENGVTVFMKAFQVYSLNQPFELPTKLAILLLEGVDLHAVDNKNQTALDYSTYEHISGNRLPQTRNLNDLLRFLHGLFEHIVDV